MSKSKNLYIEADCADNSITLSPDLCHELQIDARTPARILIFRYKGSRLFGLKRVSTKFARRTECGLVCYNARLDSYGFISLIPTVNMMFYVMGIDTPTGRFAVTKQHRAGSTLYRIEPINIQTDGI